MKTRIFFITVGLASLLSFPPLLYAQKNDENRIVLASEWNKSKSQIPAFVCSPAARHPKIALVLSGGGARGVAAIGVLKVLERAHIPVDLLVGTSIGSIIGGLYASGYSPEQLQTMVDETNWNEVLNYGDQARRKDMFLEKKIERDKSIIVLRFNGLKPIIPSAFSSGLNLTNYLNLVTLQSIYRPDSSFNDLRIPFRATATDLVSGRRVVIDRGDMTSALRASMSIPLLFTTVQKDTMQLLDGGLIGNLPVEVAIQEKADIVIAIDMMGALRSRHQLNTPWEVADQITTIMMQEANALSRKRADVVITPKLGDHLSTDFSRLDSLIDCGEEAAESALPAILSLMEKRTVHTRQDSLQYENPRWRFDSAAVPAGMQHRLKEFSEQKKVSEGDLAQMLDELSATGDYDTVQAAAEWNAGSTDITLHLVRFPVLDSVTFSGNRLISSDTLQEAVRSIVGKPVNTQQLLHALENVLRVYRSAGYSLARILQTSFTPGGCRAQVTLDEGLVGRVDIRGTEKTRDWVLRRELPMTDGSIFSIQDAKQGIANLNATNLFEQVILTVHHEGTNGEENVLTLQARERSTELIRFGLLVNNERNIQPSVDLRDENFLGTGSEIGVMAGGGSRNQSYVGEIKTARIFNTYLTFGLQGYFLSKDVNAYGDEAQSSLDHFRREKTGEFRQIRNGGTASFGMQLERLGSLIVQGRLEHIKIYNILNDPIANQAYNLSALRFGTYVDTQDKVPFPNSGEVLNLYYESAFIDIGSTVGYTKLSFSYDKYITVFNDHVLHPHLWIGFGDKTLPLSEQFSLGGQSSFWGYAEDDAFGRQIFLTSLEYRYRLPFSIFFDTYFKFRYDFGALWSVPGDLKLADFKHGLGATLAFDTPVGPAEFSVSRAFYPRSDFNHLICWGPFMVSFNIGYPIFGVN